MKHEGNLIITKYNAADFAALTSVGGDLSVRADAQLPALTSVGGYLYVEADGKLSAPLLAFDGEKYTEIARSDYVLFSGDKGNFRAGCHGPFTAGQALAHWNRIDDRAVVFTAAIKKHIGA